MRSLLYCSIVLLCATTLMSATRGITPGAPAPAELTAIVNVHIVPMNREVVLRDHAVVIRDGKIAAIGKELAIPEGARRIDGRGGYLMPGLADMHVHFWNASDGWLFLANGVTVVRNLWGTAMQLNWAKQFESGQLVGPLLFTAGPLLDGAPPIWSGSTALQSVEQARQEIRDQKKAGYDFIKVYNRLKPEVYAAIVEQAAKERIRVIGHVPNAVGLNAVLAARQACIEHLSGYLEAQGPKVEGGHWKQLAAHMDATDDRAIARLVAQTVAAGTWNCPTLIVMKSFVTEKQAQRLNERNEHRYVAPATKSFWKPRLSEEQTPINDRANALRAKLVKALHDQGAKLLLGTDTPNPYVVPGFAIHDELDLLVRAGLTPYDALRMGTVQAAAFLEQSDRFGQVRVGCRADLILAEQNPLEHVSTLRSPRGVMAGGRWFSAQELEDNLERLATSYGAPPRKPAKPRKGGG